MEAARAALAWLSERTRVSPTDWALGIEARVRALLSEAGLREGEDADRCHQESIRRLGRTRLRAELARAHLLYGEWLRREHRRAEAREQLRTALEMLDTMGMEAFAGRARRELTSAGEPVRNASGEPAGPHAVPAGMALTARRPWSPGWPATACPIPRSGADCSSAPAPSSTTCARSSPSSASALAASSTGSCLATRPAPACARFAGWPAQAQPRRGARTVHLADALRTVPVAR